MTKSATRPKQHPLMLYIDAEVYAKLKKAAENWKPPVKPGTLVRQIIKDYFEEGTTNA